MAANDNTVPTNGSRAWAIRIIGEVGDGGHLTIPDPEAFGIPRKGKASPRLRIVSASSDE